VRRRIRKGKMKKLRGEKEGSRKDEMKEKRKERNNVKRDEKEKYM
jgi:hypothetical protein